MITVRSFPYRQEQFWFGEEPDPKRHPDLAEFCQRSEPWPGGQNKPKHTLAIDLTQSLAIIHQFVHKDTRAEIRRADRDGLIGEVKDTHLSEVRDEFIEFYDGFAATKGMQPLNRRMIERVAAAGNLDISMARASSGEVLVMHSHLMVKGRVRLLHSASHFRDAEGGARRQTIGRANRWLHWQDIDRFKAAGFSIYDFGGWYAGQTDEALLRINRFKEEFGGRPVQEWNSLVALTPRGHIVMKIRQWRSRRKLASAGM